MVSFFIVCRPKIYQTMQTRAGVITGSEAVFAARQHSLLCRALY